MNDTNEKVVNARLRTRKGRSRWHLLSLVALVLALTTGFAMVASAVVSVEFETTKERWTVRKNGKVIERFDSEEEAAAAATDLKIEAPKANIVVVGSIRQKATIVEDNGGGGGGGGGEDFAFVTGTDATRPSSSWSRPALGVETTDPAYKLPVTRITSADGTRFNRNTYSRRQAENADGTLFFTYHGEAEYHVFGVADNREVRQLDIHPDAEPQWHPSNPNVIRHLTGPNSYTGSLTLRETNVQTGVETVLADFSDAVTAVFPDAAYVTDGAEGAPSVDGNRYAWKVMNDDENLIGMVTYDVAAGRVIGSTSDLRTDLGLVDAISISPSGKYVVVQWWDATYAYDANFENEQFILAEATHSDTAIDGDGHDSYVYIDFTAGENGGWVISYDLETGEETPITDLYDDTNTSIHFSGRAFDKPGWVVASTYSCKVDFGWACHKVMALNIDDGTIVNLAHTYNCGDSYWTETHASANRDLSRIYFNSDAGSCGIDAEVYRIDVPDLNQAIQN